MQPKKMNFVQLTFIVAVNMIGSGLALLPAHMAQVGKITLVSWLITSLGPTAVEYAAQSGLLDVRHGEVSEAQRRSRSRKREGRRLPGVKPAGGRSVL